MTHTRVAWDLNDKTDDMNLQQQKHTQKTVNDKFVTFIKPRPTQEALSDDFFCLSVCLSPT